MNTKYHYICKDKDGNLFMTTEKCKSFTEAKEYVGDNDVLYPFVESKYSFHEDVEYKPKDIHHYKKHDKCPICNSDLIILYGCGWDWDMAYCSNRSCKFEVEFESSTEFNCEEEKR